MVGRCFRVLSRRTFCQISPCAAAALWNNRVRSSSDCFVDCKQTPISGFLRHLMKDSQTYARIYFSRLLSNKFIRAGLPDYRLGLTYSGRAKCTRSRSWMLLRLCGPLNGCNYVKKLNVFSVHACVRVGRVAINT